jgi:hypothetical protein
MCSLTQPGRGIRKIVDLFHDLPELLEKADRHDEAQSLEPDELEERDSIDFKGMTQEQIDEERQEYVVISCYRCDGPDVTNTCNTHSRKRCHRAAEILIKLIPGFQQSSNRIENRHIFCAPVCQT